MIQEKNAQYWILKTLKTLFLTVVILVNVYPLLWMIFGSLKTEPEFFINIWGAPRDIRWANYAEAWIRARIPRSYLNSFLTTGCGLLIAIPISCCAAYAIARLNFRFKRAIYSYLLLGLCIPLGSLAIPLFLVALEFNILDSLVGVILFFAGTCVSFAVFLLRGFFVVITSSLEEAAMIDGCSRLQSFIRIILPLSKPGLMTIIIYDGMNLWNNYLIPSVLLQSEEYYTLPMCLKSFVGKYTSDFPQLFAALVMAALPIIIAYIMAQRTFIAGMTAGAVKG